MSLNCPLCHATLKLEMGLIAADIPQARNAERERETRESPRQYPSGYESSRAATGPAARPQPQKSASDLGALLMKIDDNTLDTREAEFVQQQRERFSKYGATTRMSEKQLQWLRRIAGKYLN